MPDSHYCTSCHCRVRVLQLVGGKDRNIEKCGDIACRARDALLAGKDVETVRSMVATGFEFSKGFSSF